MAESSKTHWPCRHISAMSRRGSPFRWNRLSSWGKFSIQWARLTFYNVTKKISILVCGYFYSQLYSVMNTFSNNPKHSPTSLLKWHRLLKRTTVHFYQSHLFIYFLLFSYLFNKSTKIFHDLHSYRPKLLINQRARIRSVVVKYFIKYYIQVWINWTELNWDIQRRGTCALRV